MIEHAPAGVPWWRRAVIYQVYPRSFAESPGPDGGLRGVGNLRGLIGKLDHLQWLGVDALWLSPIFRSPMADFGYDISDYCAIDPLFGTLADLDDLLEEAHRRGIRVLLDWVANHTSNEHPWFEESRRDRVNARADWYVWRDEPVNNWNAAFPPGDKAWHFDESRGQYYLRCFLPEQPDLNWDAVGVEPAMLDTLRFWLDRGVDGFRMDVIHLIAKDLERDDPPDAVARGDNHVTYNDVAAVHPRLRRIRAVLDGYPGQRVSVGEVYLLDEERLAEYYGHGDELHLSFNFAFMWTPFRPDRLRERITATLEHLAPRNAWPTWVMSNHDAPRHRQRYGGDELIARMAAMVLLTIPGTPFMYQGEELGLIDAIIPPDRVVDPGGRDGCRAPIPWTSAPDHGWGEHPWLPLPPEPDLRNVEAQLAEPTSILHFYQRLLSLRRAVPALHLGGFRFVGGDQAATATGAAPSTATEVLAYERDADGDRWFVAINIGAEDLPVHDELLGAPAGSGARIVVCTDPALEGTLVDGRLPARTGLVAHWD